MAMKRKLEEEHGNRVTASVQPITTIARRYEDAASRVPIDEMASSSESAKWWDFPPSGRFETIADIAGLNVCGDSAQVCEEVRKFVVRGVDEFIVDFRLQFDTFEDALDLFGTEVLPEFRGG